MIPELGKYAGTVMSAYGVTVVLLVGLVAQSLWRGARSRAQLRAVEGRVVGHRQADALDTGPKSGQSIQKEGTKAHG